MTSDLDIYRPATVLLNRYGDGASLYAASLFGFFSKFPRVLDPVFDFPVGDPPPECFSQVIGRCRGQLSKSPYSRRVEAVLSRDSDTSDGSQIIRVLFDFLGGTLLTIPTKQRAIPFSAQNPQQ